MKTYLSIFLVWLLIYPVAASDSTDLDLNKFISGEDIQKCINRYQISLRHHNNGVVQSAIINLIRIRMQYPNLKYACFKPDLKNLEQSGRNNDIRLLAGICMKCLERTGNEEFLNTLNEQQTRQLLNILVQANSMATH